MEKKMSNNINTDNYWNSRFGSGDWERNGGFSQTAKFAESQIKHINIESDFDGVIIDFGCGAGDSFPVYKKFFPKSNLIGVDFSEEAIKLCKNRYGNIAEFHTSNADGVPKSDVIICSNVLEHVDNDKEVLKKLSTKCKRLFIIVPYLEKPLSSEHIRTYDEFYYDEFSPISKKIFLSDGWSYFGFDLIFNVYLKNVARFIINRPLLYQRKQILFEFAGTLK